MNDLSWFLYLADVLPNIGALAGVFALVLAATGATGFFYWSFLYMEGTIKTRPWWGTFLSTVVVLGLIAVLIPSKETIYLIAGSEAGEYVVTTEAGQEIISDIQEIIKQQLKSLKE